MSLGLPAWISTFGAATTINLGRQVNQPVDHLISRDPRTTAGPTYTMATCWGLSGAYLILILSPTRGTAMRETMVLTLTS